MHESTAVTKRPIARIILVSGLLLAVLFAALVVLVPRWVKAKIIAAAAAHGVAVTIGDLALAPGHARLKNVTASALIRGDAKGAPKAMASAALVDVTLDWITPTAIDVTGMKVMLDADAGDLRTALASRNAPGGAAATITRVTIKDAALEWKHAVPIERIVITTDHVSGDVTQKGARALGDDYHLEAKDLHTTAEKDLAAWNATIDTDAQGSRVALALGKVATVAFGEGKLDVDTPSVTVKDLGLPPEALGLYGDETSHFEIHLHHQRHDDTHADGTFVGTASDVFLGASTARTSIAVDFRYAGDPAKSLALTSGTLRAGPFTGTLGGSFTIDPVAGLKASLRYASGMMACVDAIKAQAASYGAVGQGVAAFAGILGLDKVVAGRISLKGEMEIDSATHTNRVSLRTEGDCKLSYLPSAL